MNDKPGGTPDPFNAGMHAGNNLHPQPSAPTNSPSNFGARPAPSAPPVQPLSGGPASMGQKPGTLSGKPTGMTVEEFINMPGPAQLGSNKASETAQKTEPGKSQPETILPETNEVPGPMGLNTPAPAENNASPLERPMMKTAPKLPVQAKKPNKPLIIGLACLAGVLVIGVIAAVAVMMLNQPDPVAAAMNKLMTNGWPEYVNVKGDFNIQMNDDKVLVSHYKIGLESELNPSTLTNETDLTVTLGGKQMDDTTFQLSEIYAGSDDLYLKMDGVDTAIEDYFYAQAYVESGKHTEDDTEELECVDENDKPVLCDFENSDLSAEDETTADDETVADADELDADAIEETTTEATMELSYNDMLLQLMMVLARAADGQWVQMDLSEDTALESETTETTETGETVALDENGEPLETSNLTEEETITRLLSEPDELIDLIGGSRTSCTVNLLGQLRNNLSSVREFYRSNPFLGGTRDNVTLASTSYPVYRVIFDEDKYAAFVSALQNKGLLADYLKCSGKNVTDVINFPNQMPALYTEVDSAMNFTRFYFATNSGDRNTNVNIALSYPQNIYVQQPPEYSSFWDVLQAALSGEGLEAGVEIEEETVE